MKKGLFLLLAVCMAVTLFPNTASANDSMIVGGKGGTVYAISSSDVEMEEEIIDITVKDGKTYVSCQFFFHNTGEKTTIMMGFPTEPGVYDYTEDEGEEAVIDTGETESGDEYFDEEDHDTPSDEYITDLNGFRTYVRGKRVPVSIKSGLKPQGNIGGELYYPKWYTWNVTFGKGERVKVMNKYWAVNSSGLSSGWEEINYILRSGSTWKGSIGKVTVRMRMRGYDPSCVSFEEMQPSYIEDNGTIVWQAENLKPQEDIRVFCDYDYWFWEGRQNPFDEDEAEYEAYESMSIRMLNNFKVRHYNGTTWWGNRFLRMFGDRQSEQFYYLMGVSYYKRGRYDKALEMLEKVDSICDPFYDSGFYYKARIYRKTGNIEGYEECIKQLGKCEYEWLRLWAQSRMKDKEAKKA